MKVHLHEQHQEGQPPNRGTMPTTTERRFVKSYVLNKVKERMGSIPLMFLIGAGDL